MARQAESLSSQALAAAVDELCAKAAQFDDHLLTVLMDHVAQEERRIQQLGCEADLCLQIVQKHKAEIQMLQVMDRSAHSVLDSLEHKRLRQTAIAADVALKACAGFVRDFGPFLEKDAEAQARLRKLESDHAQVLRKLAPCREFLGVESKNSQARASTPTHASAVKTQDMSSSSASQPNAAVSPNAVLMSSQSRSTSEVQHPQLRQAAQPQQGQQLMPKQELESLPQQSQDPHQAKSQSYPKPPLQPQQLQQMQQLHQEQPQQPEDHKNSHSSQETHLKPEDSQAE